MCTDCLNIAIRLTHFCSFDAGVKFPVKRLHGSVSPYGGSEIALNPFLPSGNFERGAVAPRLQLQFCLNDFCKTLGPSIAGERGTSRLNQRWVDQVRTTMQTSEVKPKTA